MKQIFFDTDYLFILGLIGLSSIDSLDQYLRIFALIIAIIAGIYKIIQTHYSIKKMKNELKDKNNSDTQL